jgi:hypothetical protein
MLQKLSLFFPRSRPPMPHISYHFYTNFVISFPYKIFMKHVHKMADKLQNPLIISKLLTLIDSFSGPWRLKSLEAKVGLFGRRLKVPKPE